MRFKRNLGIVIGSVVIVVLALAYLIALGAMRFADRFTISEFKKLNKGDSYESAVKKLGMPITYFVYATPSEIGSRRPEEDVQFKYLSDYAKNNKHCVVLQYSRPRWGDYYYAFEVHLFSNQVYETRSYYHYPP